MHRDVSHAYKAYEDKLKFSTVNVVKTTRPKVAVIQEDPFIENRVEILDHDEQEEEVNINRISIPILINYYFLFYFKKPTQRSAESRPPRISGGFVRLNSRRHYGNDLTGNDRWCIFHLGTIWAKISHNSLAFAVSGSSS